MLFTENHVINIFVVIGEQPIANEIRVPRLNSGSLEKIVVGIQYNLDWSRDVTRYLSREGSMSLGRRCVTCCFVSCD